MRTTLAAATAVLVLAGSGRAQMQDDQNRRPPVAYVGAGVEVASSVGEFADYVDNAFGLGVHVAYRPNDGPLAFRAGFMFAQYGSTTARYNLVGLVSVDVTTRNQIYGLMVGPEINVGRDAVQLYGHGGVGFSYFVTRSSVEGTDQNNSPFASTTNYDDITFAAEGGGGVRVRLSRTPVFLDLGVRYLFNGQVSYVTQNTINLTTTPPSVSAITSEANAVLFRLGVLIGLRGKASPSR